MFKNAKTICGPAMFTGDDNNYHSHIKPNKERYKININTLFMLICTTKKKKTRIKNKNKNKNTHTSQQNSIYSPSFTYTLLNLT